MLIFGILLCNCLTISRLPLYIVLFSFAYRIKLIDNTILCIHGGLSPDIKTLDQIRTIVRPQEVPSSGGFCDLLWSDPEDMKGTEWMVSIQLLASKANESKTNPRGAGWLFGELPTNKFNSLNALTLIARAHQLCLEGYQYMFDKKLVTVWSAPNYSYK